MFALPEATRQALLDDVFTPNLRQHDVDRAGLEARFISLCDKAAHGLSIRLGIGRQELLFSAQSKRGKAILAIERKCQRLLKAAADWQRQVESFEAATANSPAFTGDRINLKRNLTRLMREVELAERLAAQLTDRMPVRGNPGNPIGRPFIEDCERALLAVRIDPKAGNDWVSTNSVKGAGPLARMIDLICKAVCPDVDFRTDQRSLARRPDEVAQILDDGAPIDSYEQTGSSVLVFPSEK